MTATTSKLVYTLMFDNSMLADDAARQPNIEQRRTTFTNALNNMKILVGDVDRSARGTGAGFLGRCGSWPILTRPGYSPSDVRRCPHLTRLRF